MKPFQLSPPPSSGTGQTNTSKHVVDIVKNQQFFWGPNTWQVVCCQNNTGGVQKHLNVNIMSMSATGTKVVQVSWKTEPK